MEAFFAVAVSLVVRESAAALSRSGMVRCDNDYAIFESISFSLGYVIVMGEVEVSACHLSFERAQLLRCVMR